MQLEMNLNSKDKKIKHLQLGKQKEVTGKNFGINPEILGKIAGIGRWLPIEKRLDKIFKSLKKTYPNLNFVDNPKWFATSINGQVLQYANLYASPNEFMTIVHYPFKCPAYSSRFKGMDIFSAVVNGNIKVCKEGELRTNNFRIGDVYRLKGGEVKNLEFGEGTIIIDYYRGNTLSVIPYSVLLPTLFQTGDFIGFWEQLKDSFGLVLKNVTKPNKQ